MQNEGMQKSMHKIKEKSLWMCCYVIQQTAVGRTTQNKEEPGQIGTAGLPTNVFVCNHMEL